MRIDRHTRTRDLLPLLNEQRLKEILEQVPPVPLKKSILSMTVGEYIEATDKAWPLKFFRKRRAFSAFGMLRQYRKEMEDVAKFFEMNAVPPTPEDRAAMNGVNMPTPIEGLLLEAFEGFRLSRIDGAGWLEKKLGRYGAADIPLAELMLLHKSRSASARIDANRTAAMNRKYKTKGGL